MNGKEEGYMQVTVYPLAHHDGKNDHHRYHPYEHRYHPYEFDLFADNLLVADHTFVTIATKPNWWYLCSSWRYVRFLYSSCHTSTFTRPFLCGSVSTRGARH
jgi:hypothetical protein